MRKALWHLVPILIAAFILTFIMQQSFIAAYMKFGRDAGMSAAELAKPLGVPAALSLLAPWPAVFLQLSVGARAWISFLILLAAAICIAAGLTLKDALPGSLSIVYIGYFAFLALRAAILAGGILLISQWFTAEYRGRALGLLIAGTLLAGVISPSLDWLTGDALKGSLGHESWQRAMAALGIASALVGLWSFLALANRPASAEWLEPDDRLALQEKLEQERMIRKAPREYSSLQQITQWLLFFLSSWLLALIFILSAKRYFSKFARLLALTFAFMGLSTGAAMYRTILPTWITRDGDIAKILDFEPRQIAAIFLLAIPLISAISVVAWTWHSDERRERIWHVVGPAFFAGVLALALLPSDPILTWLVLLLCAVAASLALATIWALPFAFLQGGAAAAAVAMLSSAATYGVGFASVIYVSLAGGSSQAIGTSMVATLAAIFIFSGIVTLCLGAEPRVSYKGMAEIIF